jgi:Pyruvate/2-oxoacid:ferredoxin oxidoreductase gamma subunit
MFSEITVKITGEAGQGMQTVGFNLCKLFTRAGLYVFANQDYMSRIRGGNNFFQLRVSKVSGLYFKKIQRYYNCFRRAKREHP